MYYKKTVFLWLKLVLSVLIVFPLLMIYVIDPYMFFHDKWVRKNMIYDDFRVQNYGIIKHENFDGIVMGTSMLENMSADEASHKLGGTYVNLSFSAANYFERYQILKKAFAAKNIKRVIYSLDFKFEKAKSMEITFIDLYEKDSILRKFHYYFNTRALKYVFFGRKKHLIARNYDRPRAWYTSAFHARRFGGFNNWLKYQNKDHQIQGAFKILAGYPECSKTHIQAYKEIIDTELLPLFNNQNVQFELIIPPYSMLWLARYEACLDEILKPYEYLVKQTSNLNNVRIYWQYDEDFVADISQYKDLTHYHQTVNSRQLDMIKEQTHLLTAENYQMKFAVLKERVKKFDLQYYLQKIVK